MNYIKILVSGSEDGKHEVSEQVKEKLKKVISSRNKKINQILDSFRNGTLKSENHEATS